MNSVVRQVFCEQDLWKDVKLQNGREWSMINIWQFGLNIIDIIDKNKNRCVEEPSRVNDSLKKYERLRPKFWAKLVRGGQRND